MKRTLKKSLAIILAAATILCCAPLSGIADLDLPGFGGFKKLADSVSEFFDGFAPKAKAATSGTCGKTLTWNFDESTGTLSISGTGAMTDWSSSSFAPWNSINSKIKKVVISNGVTSVGRSAFHNYESISSVTIGNSVTSIGRSAFAACTSLTGVTIGNSVTSIGGYAFFECISLTSITIPDSVKTIGDDAFSYCTSLTSITVGTNNSSFSNDKYGVLFNKDKTVLVQYPKGNTRTNYTVPDTVTSIGDYAFTECDHLTSVIISDGVTNIGGCAFVDCYSLTSVTVPDSVTSIGDFAFYNCTSLTDVYYSGSESEWNAISIRSDNEDLTNATIHFNSTISSDAIEYNDHYYKVIDISMSWKEAKAYCESLGGHLITITSKEEDDFAFGIINESFVGDCWFGATDEKVEGMWEWVTGEKFEYTNWDSGQPDNDFDGTEDYLGSYYGSTWNDFRNDDLQTEKWFICEWDNSTSNVPDTPGGETPKPVYYDVTWNANGGKWSDGDIRKYVTTKAGGNITAPSDPEKRGYEFVGWTPAIPQTMPNCDLTFTAVWQEAVVTPSPEDIAKQKYIDEHVKFAKSSTFVSFKDENLANQFSEIIRDSAEYHWNNFIGLNFFTNYYDVVVAQVISSEEMHNAFVNMMNSYLVNNVRSVYTDIFDSINTIDGSTGLDEFEFFDMFMSKDLSAYKGTPIYNSVLHAFGKNKDDLVAKIFKGTDYVNRGLTLASSAVDIVEGITDCVYYKSALDAYRQTNVYFKEVLKMVADSDIDSGLKKAISNFADASNEEDYLEYADTLFTKWKSVGVRKGLKISCDLFLGKLLAGTAKVILNIPLKGGATLASKTLTITTKSGGTVVATAAQVASGAVTGVTLGMTVSSILVNSGDFSYNAAACAHMGDFANAVWPILTKLEQQLTANPTFENALYFENAFALYKEIQIMSVKDMIAIAEAKNDSFVYWLFRKKEDVSDFVAMETKFRNLNCHTSDFSELLAGEYKRKEATGYKVNVTACPVDVYVYDSNGTLVARVINDFAEVFDNRISVHVIDSVKYFGLPNDEEYSIRISATDEGKMDYSVFEFNENAVMTRDVSTENIPLAEGKTFTGKIDNITNTDIENYNLIVSETGEVIEAEKETDCIHATGISISQTVAEMKVGEKISLSASVTPSDSTDIILWHSSDESVAKVSKDGVVEAVGEGEVIVKAIANSSVYSECKLTVAGTEEYTITWVWCDEKWSFSYPVGSELPMVQGSVPDGYIFIGYSPEIPDVMPAKNLILTAMFESISEHQHSYKCIGVVDSTCDTEGYEIYSCICHDSYEVPTIPAKGHTPGTQWIIYSPTCIEDGKEVTLCSVCGKGCVEEVIPAKGHNFDMWVISIEPSCTEDGEKIAYCNECGVIAASEIIPATGHTPGEWITVVDPTTESCGEKIKKCIECNEIVDGALIEELPEVTIINGTITEGTCVIGETITVVPKQINGKIFRRWSVTGAFVEPIATTNSVLSVYLETEEVTITAEYDDCECKCHQGGIAGFFFKIVLFFQKLFGNNIECFCGEKH